MNFFSPTPFALFALLLGASIGSAQEAAPQEPVTVMVGVAMFPPNVEENEDGGFQGFDIDLWSEIAGSLDLEYSYRAMPFEQLLSAVREGSVDVALAGITITARREEDMDFSHPYMASGLRILSSVEQSPALVRLFRSLSRSAVLRPVGYLIGFVLLCAHVLYFVERGTKAVSREYLPGIFEAAWCILATMTTVGYGDITPHGWPGRAVAFFVMVTGIGLFGILIAQLSSGLTLEELTTEISGAEGLRDRPVATIAGSTSVSAAQRYGARVREVNEISQAYRLLDDGAVDAVVFDAPALMHRVKQDETGSVSLVGPLMNRQDYGIAFPAGSPLRERVNRALLSLKESDAYDQVFMKWFGEANPH